MNPQQLIQPRSRTSFFVNNGFVFASNSNCYVELYVDKSTYLFLIDTGATISAIKYKHVIELNIPIHKESIKISGIGGTVEAIGYVYLTMSNCYDLGGQTFKQKFYVFNSLPCMAHAILGQDFLMKFNAVLDYGCRSLTLNNNDANVSLPLKLNNTRGSYNLTLPPRSESIHYIPTDITEECLVCSSELRTGIFIASVLVKPINGVIPILILNTNETEAHIDTIDPTLHKISEYHLCTFEQCGNINADRVRKLFSLLSLKHLNEEEQITIENICAKFSDIFLMPGDKLTTTNIYKHKISLLPNAQPVFSKPYRIPYSQKPEVNKQISNMLREGIIEPCQSEWSSPMLLVPKKADNTGNKNWRLVIDYRKLNNCIQEDKFPLPNITEILDSLSGSVYFTTLDLSNGYYQCDLDSDSRKYTAFCSGQFKVSENEGKSTASLSGQYQMTRMPMGLKTSPNAFSKMMTIAMSGLTYEKCLVYLDDLIIFGNSLENHNKNLIDVFTRLRQVNLKLNPRKCNFLKKDILYLGHVITSEGVLPDPEKISALSNWPIPKNLEELIRFIAFANYYRKFIKNFANIAYPLTKLTKKNALFIWDQECQTAFSTLKSIISSPPILQYPNFSSNHKFILQTDASKYSLGAVLCNDNRKPIAFASRNLNKAEINYPTGEKELLAIVWAVKHFRPYLYGRTFVIETDHKPLIYLFGMRDPSSRLLKFRLLLEEYDFIVEYIKGSTNIPADSMSRLPITSTDLKNMHESIITVMTRSQYRNVQESQHSPSAMGTTDDWPAQPRVVEIHSKSRMSVELKFIDNDKLNNLRRSNDIDMESKEFCYSSSKMTLFINPVARSQLTPAAFVRELKCFCEKLTCTN